ncbi:SemiSWEET family sugar transporter [Halomicronema sp. CCY15110]|uniref:SemiSWEET family sugar transporter n=1 Tax=Halomicronema sp. CCY15110 TaxID=2767773 RepID=UPI00194FB6CF|nr:SemiSWEET transporter [Halomicronema sp. CCY15110]
MDSMTALGIVAGSLTTLAYLPQVLKTWRSRSADGMSWSMLIILCLGIALWLVYGVYVHDMPLIMANLLTLVFSSAILGIKIRYEAMPKLRSPRQLFVPGAATLQSSISQNWQIETEVTFTQPEPESSSPVA